MKLYDTKKIHEEKIQAQKKKELIEYKKDQEIIPKLKKQFSNQKILYLNIPERGFKIMKEQELNTLMSVVSDPINNVYKINSHKDLEEIQRIIRIFNISKEQHNKHTMLSIKNLATFRLVLSNN